MSVTSKILIALLLLVQIGIVSYSFFKEPSQEENLFQPKFERYLVNPAAVDSMDLSGQELDQLIDNMEQFKNLKYLDLSINKFQTFPLEVLKLPKLEVLKMGNNQISTINFTENNSLKRLYLNFNTLQEVKNLEALKALEYVRLDYNNLSTFPKIGTQSLIDTMLIHNNGLSDMYNFNKSLEKPIRHLDLSSNFFESAESFESLSNHVESLVLYRNLFNEFPVNLLNESGKIKKLNFSTCGLQDLNIEEASSEVIEELNISNNYFMITGDKLNRFPNLKSLNISRLKINNLSLSLDSLERLDMSYITLFNSDCSFNLPNLKELIVDNWFLELNVESFQNSSLEKIYIIDKDRLTDTTLVQQQFPNAKITVYNH